MRVWLCVLIAFLASARLTADIGPIPGTELVQPVFDEADLVCKCRIDSVAIVRQEKKSADGRPTTMVKVAASILDSYKSGPDSRSPIVFEYPLDPMSREPGIRVGHVALLFLSKRPSGAFALTNRFIGLTIFGPLSSPSSGSGMERLQSALGTYVVQSHSRDDQMNAMRLLQGFDQLAPSTLAAVAPLSLSADSELAFTALGVLLKTKTPDSVAALKRYIDDYHGNDEPVAIMSVGLELGQVTDLNALSNIEALSDCKFVSIRYGAMEAIRRMASAKSAAFLIQRLDDSNPHIRYSAIITLAEIFKKGGDYGPSVELFQKDPPKYVGLWKKWWTEEGAQQAER